MSQLFDNAVASLRMGVQDFQSEESDRALSAVRNFYAGLLLLAKEVLVRAAPEAEMDEIIGAKYKPVPDGSGGVYYVKDGGQTIDFNTIASRFKDFGIAIDHGPLKDLNRIRNDIEHRYTDQSDEFVREAIAKAFPVAVALFRLADEDPAEVLSDEWGVMIETNHLYEVELQRCRATLIGVGWISETVASGNLRCPECGSELVEQLEPENKAQDSLALHCLSCDEHPETEQVIVAALEEKLAGMSFLRAKDSGDNGPIHLCPECGQDAYVDFEEACAVCGHNIESVACVRCGNALSMDELIYGSDSGLCSYCNHVSEKIMSE
jgi:hypothetical protein